MIHKIFIVCKFKFSYKSSIKNTQTGLVLNSISEKTDLSSFSYFLNTHKIIKEYFGEQNYTYKEKREVANCVVKDMLLMVSAWRQIKGYPTGGNTTHTNAKTAKKNKLLLDYRVTQYFNTFGKKRRNIYPTLVKAEYTNRLWYHNWVYEWAQSALFALRMAEAGNKVGSFNPALLAVNQVNGFIRTGAASKIGKAKRLTKVYTLGVPLFFAQYIYPIKTPADFPRIILKDEVNKQLGKKLRKKLW